ncbi:hypothetical protein LB507_000875, partial [Fusarium sp. FIESC RH6]
MMASRPVVPANAPAWIKGWAKENTDFRQALLKLPSFTKMRFFSLTHEAFLKRHRTQTPVGLNDYVPPAPQLEDEPVEPVARTARVAWVAAEDRLCNNAKARLSAKAPETLTLSARTWKCEMDNMFSPSDREPDLVSTDGNPHATRQDKRLTEHVNDQTRTQFEKRSASRGATTISEFAKQLAQANPDEWADYLHAYRQKLHDPEMFDLNHVRNNQFARDLLSHVLIDKVKIVCCTPIALEQIVSHTGLQVDFVTIDDAHLMTDAMTAVVMSKCPRASLLLVGDTKSPQRVPSLLERMENAGAITHHLKSEYRSG